MVKSISSAKNAPEPGRIVRLRRRYQSGPAYISIERARYYTESWLETEGREMALPLRAALAMNNVYEKMTHYLNPDDKIAGYWTEFFLGVPIDIERGVFNQVFASELTRKEMLSFRVKTALTGLSYTIRKRSLGEFLKNQKMIKAGGSSPLNLDLKTMPERKINRYLIKDEDRRALLKELLPLWKGKTIVDQLEKEMANSGLYSRDMHDFVYAISGNSSRQVLMVSAAATISTYQGHVILNYTPVLEKGLLKMEAEVAELLGQNEMPEHERVFLQSIQFALSGVNTFARRLAERIAMELDKTVDDKRRNTLEEQLEVCTRVPFKPAETFREAIQSLWTVKTAVELAHPVNLHCFGRLDQTLYPYYQADLEAKRITAEAARELIEELLLKIMSQNIRPESNLLANFYHRFLGSSPVTVGGVDDDGEDCTNELTYLFLEAAHRSKAITNISVRVHNSTPDALLEKVAEYLFHGTSSFSLFNDEINIEAMRKRGFSEEDAKNYAIMGCVEATCPGKTGSMSANALLLCRLLDITMRNGAAQTAVGKLQGEGLKTGDPDCFESFDHFLEAFWAQGRQAIEKITAASNLRDRLYAEKLPAPYISAFIDGCLDKRRDITGGGGRYDLSGISMINSIANLIDSLLVIKKLIFEEKRFTFRELLQAMDHNFALHEEIYLSACRAPGKWGNGDPQVDELAARVMKELFAETYKYRSFKGGPFVVYLISMITHTIDGRLSMASPDGRKAATPFAASCNPYNVERAGVTAALRSVASLPFEDVMGCAVNVKFHPSAVGGHSTARAKWVSLVRTYFQLGGSQIQPTVAGKEMLQEAQIRPEQYRDLIVKVGGYSTYFVDLGREIQEEIIARTEHR